VKTGPGAVSVVQVNYAFDKRLTDPDQLLDRYHTLTGWSEALRAAGAARVSVVQRFHRNARLSRNGIDYEFRRSAIEAAVAATRADVAHVNGLDFPGQTWRLRRALDRGSALVVQGHSDGGAIGRAPLFRLLGRLSRQSVDAWMFAADEHAMTWRRAGFLAPGRPVYQVMEASTRMQGRPRAIARAASGVDGSPAIVWVGRLNANKDPLTVIDAFERSLRDLPEATLWMIYTEDDLLPAVRQRLRSPALAGRVHLCGAVAYGAIAAFYSAADLFVLGSHHEGSGYSVMEACACGAAPVVTGIPTFRLLTGGGSIGSLWAPGDAEDCARALVAAARRDPAVEHRRTLDHFARELSWEAVGRRALHIYEQVVAARRTPVHTPRTF
jgi:glycosyltransferase involved in cell wall biosynthesis